MNESKKEQMLVGDIMHGYKMGKYLGIDPARKEYDKMCYNAQVRGIWIGDSFDIQKVVFHDPATIVYWADGTKTVVKAGKDDVFDPEKGLAMAFAKKALGNTGRYYNTFKQLIKDCMKEEE
jgi:hypothetical protein